ncbi:hypothetical protein V8C34DRAFT_198057 [Trichoderma compactum]
MPETAPVSLSWVQSQNLGKSGDAWSRNGVPRDDKPPDRISRPGATDWDTFHGPFSFSFFSFFFFLPRLFSRHSGFPFSCSVFLFAPPPWPRGPPRTHARTDQISVMPLGNSIINSHGAKPGVNASTVLPERCPCHKGAASRCTVLYESNTHWS